MRVHRWTCLKIHRDTIKPDCLKVRRNSPTVGKYIETQFPSENIKPPGHAKISHKKDGCQRWPHRFHVSRPSPTPPPLPLDLLQILTAKLSSSTLKLLKSLLFYVVSFCRIYCNSRLPSLLTVAFYPCEHDQNLIPPRPPDGIITTRKQSLRRLCFYTCLSVIQFTGGITRAGTPLGRYLPGRYTLPWQCMLGYGQQVGGTHPTGMHSCFVYE